MMRRSALLCVLALLALAAPAAAQSPMAGGFPPPHVVGANLEVLGSVAAADAAGGPYAAVAFADRSGGIWAFRVRSDGTTGSPLPAAADQADVRDVQVAITERGEIVVVWAALVNRSGRAAVRYAVAAPGRSFSGARTLAAVGSNTSATPRIAALRGGTVAVVFRETHPPSTNGVLRYARRAPGGAFGPARSLGHDGVSPEIAAAPGGGALLAWGRGPVTRRALEIATARRGAPLPGPATSVAGRVRAQTLATSSDGTAWVTWTRRTTGPASGFARRTRAANRGAVGPVQDLGAVAYGVPRVAVGGLQPVLAAWNAVGPGVSANVRLASAPGIGATLGPGTTFDAGGFSQTSPVPVLRGSEQLILFTRQIPTTSGAPAEAAIANPSTGATAPLGGAASIAAPAVAHAGSAVIVAWAATGGGIAVTAA